MHQRIKPPCQCQVCGNNNRAELRRAILAGSAVAELVLKAIGSWNDSGWICTKDLNKFRHEHVKALLEAERGELSALDSEVLESLKQQETLSRNPLQEMETNLTLGQRLADKIASFGGSWYFLISFSVTLLLWVAVNSLTFLYRPFDPYPFIFLNLILSCLAAVQAPVIMMSQNRQEARDRIHAQHDYQVNLKAELEIRHLHQKIDHLLNHQWERLVEIQEIQMDLMADSKPK